MPNSRAIASVLFANLLILVNTGLRSSTAILTMPLMIASLGREHYGVWVATSTVTMLAGLAEGGLGQTVVNYVGRYFTRKEYGKISEVAATAFGLYWIMILPALILMVCVIELTPAASVLLSQNDLQYLPVLKTCLSVSIGLTLCRVPFLVFPGILIGVRKLPVRLVWEIMATLCALIGIVGALLAGLGVVGVVGVANTIMLVANSAVSLSTVRLGPWARIRVRNFNPALLGVLASNSFFFFVINASAVLERSATILLVPPLASLDGTAPFFLVTSIYRVAAQAIVAAPPRAV